MKTVIVNGTFEKIRKRKKGPGPRPEKSPKCGGKEEETEEVRLDVKGEMWSHEAQRESVPRGHGQECQTC